MDLSKDYAKLLETGELYDTEILIGKEPKTKIYRLHSLILKVRSPYFRTAFSSDWIKIENNIVKFQKQNISVEIFDIIINFIYSSKRELANDVKTNVELLIAADELCLDELCSYVEKYLLKDKESLKSNFILISNVADQFNHFIGLSKFYKDAFQQDPSLIFKANDFATIKQEILLDILANGNHSLNPIEVWDKLMEWAIFQSNELPSDIIIWTADNVSTFGALMQQFIPHINFQEITPSDFSQKIKPFKDIFNNDTYLKFLEYYAFNDKFHSKFKTNIDSKFINTEQAFFLAHSIKVIEVNNNKLKVTESNFFYELKLFDSGESGDEIVEKNKAKVYDENVIGPVIFIFKAKDTKGTNLIGGIYKHMNKYYVFYLDNDLENCIYFECGENSLNENIDLKMEEYEVFQVIRKS